MSFFNLSGILALILVWALPLHCADFPVPEALEEWRLLEPISAGYGSRGTVDFDEFLAITGPCAPLDLQVTFSPSHEVASELKNMYLGLVGRNLHMDFSGVKKAPDIVLCQSEPCIRERLDRVTAMQDTLRLLDTLIRKANDLRIVAQWGKPGSYRADNLFVMPGDLREAVPSPILGFIPSGEWIQYASEQEYLANRNYSLAEVTRIVDILRNARLAAVTLSPSAGVEVILNGISDNKCFVLFPGKEKEPPRIGADTQDGFELVFIQEVAPGMFLCISS